MRTPAPSYDQVCALPEVLRTEVPAEYGDPNGHMNVRHYLAVHDDAGWRYFASLGFDADYLGRRRRNFFDLEHHLTYRREVLVGDLVSVHVRLLARSAKVLHLLSFLVNRTREEVANTLELTTAHVDLDTRRTVPLDAADAKSVDRQLQHDTALAWPAPVCGVVGVQPGLTRA